MFFVGAYELTIDAKNRLSIPHVIRSRINYDEDGRSFYVVPGRQPGTLALFPDRYFEQTRRNLPPADELSDEGYAWRQFEYSQSALLDPDAQGRILIPERLLRRAGIGREVTLIGAHDRLELWSREAFAAFEEAGWPDYPERRKRALAEIREWQAAHPRGPQASAPSSAQE